MTDPADLPPPPRLSALELQKRDLRAHMLAARRGVAEQDRLAASQALADQFAASPLAGLARAGQVAAGYWPMGDEIDPRPLLVHLASHLRLVVALPVVVRRAFPLEFRRWAAGDTLEIGPHGTRHPTEDCPVLTPDLVLLPLLAFDKTGGRLGYGGGYYDRTLDYLRSRRPVVVVGLGYAAQQVDAVPCDGHDQKLDWVLTERGLLRTGVME